MVRLGGIKMSKSLGNLVFVHDLLKDWEGSAIRLAVLTHHYRSDWDWHDGLMPEAADRLARWRAAGPGDGGLAEVRRAPGRRPGHAGGGGGHRCRRGRRAGGVGGRRLARGGLRSPFATGRMRSRPPDVRAAYTCCRWRTLDADRPLCANWPEFERAARQRMAAGPPADAGPGARRRPTCRRRTASPRPAPPKPDRPGPSAPVVFSGNGDPAPQITVYLPDDSSRQLPAGSTGVDLAAAIGPRLARAAVAVDVDGAARDLTTVLPDGARVAVITAGTDAGRHILRHSTAHVLAQAVTDLWPGAHYAIGPPIEDGFYYDFELPGGQPLSARTT